MLSAIDAGWAAHGWHAERRAGFRTVRRLSSLLMLCFALAACTSSGSLFSRIGSGDDDGEGENGAAPTGAREAIVIDTEGLAVYLATMQQLIEGDSLTQAEIFNELRDNAEFAPTAMNRLLYALALAIPGHNGSDANAAALRLRDLLAAGDLLLPEERMLAQIQLQTAARLQVLGEVTAGYDEQLAEALASQDQEHAAELRRAQAETEAVQAELDDALAQLEAITDIERSISEREDDEE